MKVTVSTSSSSKVGKVKTINQESCVNCTWKQESENVPRGSLPSICLICTVSLQLVPTVFSIFRKRRSLVGGTEDSRKRRCFQQGFRRLWLKGTTVSVLSPFSSGESLLARKIRSSTLHLVSKKDISVKVLEGCVPCRWGGGRGGEGGVSSPWRNSPHLAAREGVPVGPIPPPSVPRQGTGRRLCVRHPVQRKQKVIIRLFV